MSGKNDEINFVEFAKARFFAIAQNDSKLSCLTKVGVGYYLIIILVQH